MNYISPSVSGSASVVWPSNGHFRNLQDFPFGTWSQGLPNAMFAWSLDLRFFLTKFLAGTSLKTPWTSSGLIFQPSPNWWFYNVIEVIYWRGTNTSILSIFHIFPHVATVFFFKHRAGHLPQDAIGEVDFDPKHRRIMWETCWIFSRIASYS